MIQEVLWKVLGMLICVVMLFVVPTMLSYQRQDAIAYNLVQVEVQAFGERVRESGYVDHMMVRELEAKLSATGNRFDMKLEHLEKSFADDGGGMRVYYKGSYTGDILEAIDGGARYDMHVGDFFYVRLTSTALSASQSFNRILGMASGGPGIHVVSGGIVRYGDH